MSSHHSLRTSNVPDLPWMQRLKEKEWLIDDLHYGGQLQLCSVSRPSNSVQLADDFETQLIHKLMKEPINYPYTDPQLRQLKLLEPGYTIANTVTIIPVFHGTTKDIAESITRHGFDDDTIGSTDQGFFGQGFYVTPDPDYAAWYSKDGTIVACYVAINNIYPVTYETDYVIPNNGISSFNLQENKVSSSHSRLYGKPLLPNFDAHYATVTANAGEEGPEHVDCGKYSELVVRDRSQILPLCVLSFEKTQLSDMQTRAKSVKQQKEEVTGGTSKSPVKVTEETSSHGRPRPPRNSKTRAKSVKQQKEEVTGGTSKSPVNVTEETSSNGRGKQPRNSKSVIIVV